MPLFAPILQLPARYWQELQEEERKDENKVKNDGEQSKEALQQEEDKTQKAKKRKQDQSPSDGEKVKPEVRVHELLLTDKNHAIISCSCLNSLVRSCVALEYVYDAVWGTLICTKQPMHCLCTAITLQNLPNIPQKADYYVDKGSQACLISHDDSWALYWIF